MNRFMFKLSIAEERVAVLVASSAWFLLGGSSRGFNKYRMNTGDTRDTHKISRSPWLARTSAHCIGVCTPHVKFCRRPC